jgi:hypothetical protein
MRNDNLLKWKRLVESMNRMAMTEENMDDSHSNDHPDHEVSMAKSQLLSSVKSATRIAKHLSHTSEEDGLEGWVASKITMAQDYLQVVADYMDGEHIHESVEVEDKVDTVTLDVPLLLRMIEFGREDAKDDMAVHSAVERMVALAKNGTLTMADYGDIAGDIEDTYDTLDEDIIEETYEGDEFYEAYGVLWFNEDEQLDEAEYQGRKVPLGKPMRGDVKKFKVYVKNEKGNVVKVNFGDPDMKIKKSNPARRKSFRARHNCDNPGPRTKARYWSCRKW